MSLSTMSRRDRTVMACLGVALLYGVAVLLWCSGRADAWERSRKGYERERNRYEREKRLIAEKNSWKKRADEVSLKMPVAEEDESTQTRWLRRLESLAKEHKIAILNEQPKPEEEHGGVWEMPIEVKYEASLSHLVEFLYAIGHAEDAMFDVRDLDVTSKNTGFLTGRFTLTCAYMKGPEK